MLRTSLCFMLLFSLISFGAHSAARPMDEAAVGVQTRSTADASIVSWQGAPRFINQVEFRTQARAWTIEQGAGIDDWVQVAAGLTPTDGHVVARLETALITNRIRIRGVEDEPGSRVPVPVLFPVAGMTHPPETPHGSTCDEGSRTYHYDWITDYPGTKSDLSQCDDDARGLNNLPGDWSRTGGHGDWSSFEIHLKSSAVGSGANNSHSDAADIAYFSGHGRTGTTDPGYGGATVTAPFWGTTEDDDTLLPSDAENALGGCDLEWLAFSACAVLNSASRPYWHGAMDQLHLLLGASSLINDSPYGPIFVRRMNDSGPWDIPWTVKNAWFSAIEKYDESATAVVMGENSTMGSDYLHGEGSGAADDPTVNSSYTVWTYDTSGSSGPGVVAPASSRRPLPALQDPVRFDPGEDGIVVLVDRARLQGTPTSMPRLLVQPSSVDTSGVRGIANSMCLTVPALCGGALGDGDPGESNVTSGLSEVRVHHATGAWEYTDLDQFQRYRTNAPQLPTDVAAPGIADQMLNSWNLRPSNASVKRVDHLMQLSILGSVQTGTEQILPESTFATGTRVVYERRAGPADQFRVAGPGGYLAVTLGSNGALQRAVRGAWRPVTVGPLVPIASIDSALSALANEGWRVCLNPPRLVASTIVVNSWEPGYYEPSAYTPAAVIRPVFLLQCTIVEPTGVQHPYELALHADATLLRARILDPENGSIAPIGSLLCLRGESIGGTPPFQFRWTDSRGVILGTTDSVCVSVSALQTETDGGIDSVRTIQLEIQDALGGVSYDYVRVRPIDPVAVEPIGTGAGLSLSAVAPNPFVDAAQLSFRVPAVSTPTVRVRLAIYSITGRQVRVLVEGEHVPGDYVALWDGRNESGVRVPPGLYFSRLESPLGSRVRKLTLID